MRPRPERRPTAARPENASAGAFALAVIAAGVGATVWFALRMPGPLLRPLFILAAAALALATLLVWRRER